MRRLRRAAFALLGLLLALIPLFPVRAVFGDVAGTGFLVGPGEWLLGLAVFGTVAWLAGALAREGSDWLADGPRTLGRLPERWRAPVALGLLAVILAVVSAGVFAHRPLLVDSVVQVFQAKIFATGALVAPPPELPEFFDAQHLLVDANGWYGQYPPGHAALLALGVVLGAPWLVPIALTLGTVWFLHRFAATAYGDRTANLTLLLALACPFLWFMGASFMNHVSALFFLSLALWLLARWEAGEGGAHLVGAGAALGAACLSRPLTALAVGAVLGACLLPRARERRAIGAVSGALLAAAGVSSLYLAFNAATTGDPFLPGYLKLWGDAHGLGFHPTPWGEVHGPLQGLRNELTDLSLLALHVFEWPIPALLPMAALFLVGGDGAWDRRLLLAFLAVPAAYFFYWHRDAYLGPRFLYSTLAFLLPLTARGLEEVWRRLPEMGGRPGLLRPDPRVAFAALMAGCFTYALAYGAPRRYEVYASGMGSMKADLVAEAGEAGVDRGLVFVAVSWGNRLLTGLQAAGADRSLAEIAYRTTDHCRLQGILDRARREGWSEERFTEALSGLAGGGAGLVKTAALNGDPTLRVDPDRPLTPACLEEVRYDRRGYTVYAPHLLVNRPDLSGPLVVARDLRDGNGRLRALYPDRPVYFYRSGRLELSRKPMSGAARLHPERDKREPDSKRR